MTRKETLQDIAKIINSQSERLEAMGMDILNEGGQFEARQQIFELSYLVAGMAQMMGKQLSTIDVKG